MGKLSPKKAQGKAENLQESFDREPTYKLEGILVISNRVRRFSKLTSGKTVGRDQVRPHKPPTSLCLPGRCQHLGIFVIFATHLPPHSLAILFLKKPLVVGNSILSMNKSKSVSTISLYMDCG